VVLNSFSIHFCDAFRNAERAEKRDNSFMPGLAGGGQVAASIRQENRAIGLRGYKAALLESRNGAIDGDVCDAETFCQVDDARFAGFGDQIGDGLNVILRDFVGVLAAGLG